MTSSVAGASHQLTSRINTADPPGSIQTPTIGWLMQTGSLARSPRRQAVKAAPLRSPAARIVQSSARWRYFTTYRCPSITTRYNRAPDLPEPPTSGSRADAPASSVSTESATGTAAARLDIGSLHLGEQCSRPAPAAQDRIGDDEPVADREDVRMVCGVRHALLGPREGVLDHLTLIHGQLAQLLERAGIGEPLHILRPDRIDSSHPEPPVRHRRVEHGIGAPSVATGDRGRFTRGEKPIDGKVMSDRL